MISIKDVKKKFTGAGGVDALTGVTANVSDGSIFGLIGSNGSGKSTLMRIMCGIFRADSGDVLYDGVPIYENYALKQRIVYLSDEQYFLPHATLSDMRAFYRSAYDTFDDQLYMKMTETFGLDRDRKINTFSKGMQKQSALLLGLSVRPKYILCDETFDGIDPVMRQIVRRMIADDVAESGLTAVISTHNLRELEDLTDHICLLHRGAVMLDRELDDMKLTIHKVQAVFDNDDAGAGALRALDIVSHEAQGRLQTFVCRGSEEEINSALAAASPIYSEIIPLTLEEIFISEMEGIGYDAKNIIQ